jgi:gamma-glutamyl-gamma-aminobutyrate hydrolase PuuD
VSAKRLVLGYCSGNGGMIEPFDSVFDDAIDVTRFDPKGVDAVVFWGGTDIHPSYYGHKANTHSQVFFSKSPSHRDEFEWRLMLWCKINRVPMIGVCRGAQLMCAFAGGKLIQHITGHNSGNHMMVTKEGLLMETTSCHHQMMYPFDIQHDMIAWSSIKKSLVYQEESEENNKFMMSALAREPEIVAFPQINGLAIQGHPEWL